MSRKHVELWAQIIYIMLAFVGCFDTFLITHRAALSANCLPCSDSLHVTFSTRLLDITTVLEQVAQCFIFSHYFRLFQKGITTIMSGP